MINFEFDLDADQEVFVGEILSTDKTIIFCNSCAGTGKTTLAMGAANVLVKDRRNEFDGIVYIVSPYGEENRAICPAASPRKARYITSPHTRP